MIKIGKDISSFSSYSCKQKTREDLDEIIGERIFYQGNNCDLNDIDVSLITDMSGLFSDLIFNGDISNWNTSNVTDMSYMFANSKFNGVQIYKIYKDVASGLNFDRGEFQSLLSDVIQYKVKTVLYNK